ncbi:MAG: GntR family transcriptional regulator [Chloroflexi bacterium]|nr:GntR family transcriptional regulator [Chloroflexota bacterium]
MPIRDASYSGSDGRTPRDEDYGLPDLSPLAAPRKLAEDASAILREQILSGSIRRGTHLIEAKLASRLGVSRGTVREAFKTLVGEGLIEEEPRRGAFVVTLNRNDVREIYDVRAAIEGRAARLLATRGDRMAVAELRAAVDEIRTAALTADVPAVRRADLQFHERLCALSGNRRLHAIFVRHVPAIQTLLDFDELPYPMLATSADQHQALLEAIETGDPEFASRRLEAHVEEARERVAAYFDELDPEGHASVHTHDEQLLDGVATTPRPSAPTSSS